MAKKSIKRKTTPRCLTKPGATPAQLKKVLACAIKLFENPNNFTTLTWARDKFSQSIHAPKSPRACSWCFEGGLMKCSPDFPPRGGNDKTSPIYVETRNFLQDVSTELFGTSSLQVVNDRNGLFDVRRVLAEGQKRLKKLTAKPRAKAA